MGLFSKLFGDEAEKEVKKLQPVVEQINALEEKYKALKNDGINQAALSLKKEHQDGRSLDDILPDMFALTREAARRTLGQRHYNEQLMGGMILHRGHITEMKTGEGKTLAATLAVALNALSGKGAHVVTVNDYLAKRDTVWMGQIYHLLGFSVGCVNHDASYLYDPSYKAEDKRDLDEQRDTEGGFRVIEEFLRPVSRQEAYQADITYGTNNEFGFDWLRDNLEIKKESIRQRAHYFAIVDEVDSILIDEARTPLIISAPDTESEELYKIFAHITPQLKAEQHYDVDEKLKAATLTEDGIERVEKLLGVKDIYTERGVRYVRHLEQALRARVFFKRDRDYVVKNGEVIIVDEFTGRLMPGRRWSDGLHQAVEAAEGVQIQKESRTLASITFQNYFKMYDKLAGMTGTGKTSEEEFEQVYKLRVFPIPTHKPMIREDAPDAIYQSMSGKWTAVVKRIKECNKRGRPVLVGTVSIQNNEKLSALLRKEGIKHEVLNAKNHEREGEIIAQAGRKSAVTVATNMAGRGVDVILGGAPYDEKAAAEVCSLGGLFVLGTERHEARRIDNQLRGRSGRQGDPGSSQFFASLEDDLLRVFASERLKKMMGTFGIPEDQPIESKMVSRSIESAQEKIEGFHFDARKHLLDYDNVLSKQRSSVYNTRREMLFGDDKFVRQKIDETIAAFIENAIDAHTPGEIDTWRREEIAEIIKNVTGADSVAEELIGLEDRDAIKVKAREMMQAALRERIVEGVESFYDNARMFYLQIIDYLWRDHLEVMEYTRNSVRLRAYGQHDPLVEYKNEGVRHFRTFHEHLQNLFIQNIFKVADHESHAGHSHVPLAPPPPVAAPASSPTAYALRGGDGKKIGRNDPCPCGSGKKYKRCHGA